MGLPPLGEPAGGDVDAAVADRGLDAVPGGGHVGKLAPGVGDGVVRLHGVVGLAVALAADDQDLVTERGRGEAAPGRRQGRQTRVHVPVVKLNAWFTVVVASICTLRPPMA